METIKENENIIINKIDYYILLNKKNLKLKCLVIIYTMKKPILLRYQKLTNFKTKDEREILLTLRNSIKPYHNINEAKKDLKVKTANEAYKILLNNFNEQIDKQNKFSKQLYEMNLKNYEQTTNKNLFKSLPSIVTPINEKKTKEERKDNYEKYKSLVKRDVKIIDKKRPFDKKVLKALGAFEQVTFNVYDDKDISFNELKEILTNELTHAFYSKQKDKNLFANIIVSYLKEKEGEELNFYFEGKFAENLKSFKYISDFVNNFIL